MTKNKLMIFVTILLAVTAGAVAFQVSRSREIRKAGSCQAWMCGRLGLNDEQYNQVLEADPDYEQEAADLSAAFVAARQQLGHTLTLNDSTDSSITAQVDNVIAANSRLVHRIVAHILLVRNSLSPEQQQQFTELCKQIIRGRQAGKLLQRPAGTEQESFSPKGGARNRFGAGNSGFRGGGNGNGYGSGHRYRYRGGLQSCIEFTPEQRQLFEQIDPEFDAESASLAEAVSQQQDQLALLLASSTADDAAIFAQLDQTLETRSQLEHRTVQYVLRIRSHLTLEQQKMLVGLCARCGNNSSEDALPENRQIH